MRMAIEAAIAALGRLSDIPLTRACLNSQSTLQKVHNSGSWHERPPYVLYSKLQEIIWIYCSGLAGVSENEKADSLTSEATIIGTQTMKRNNALRTLKDNLKSEMTIEETTLL